MLEVLTGDYRLLPLPEVPEPVEVLPLEPLVPVPRLLPEVPLPLVPLPLDPLVPLPVELPEVPVPSDEPEPEPLPSEDPAPLSIEAPLWNSLRLMLPSPLVSSCLKSASLDIELPLPDVPEPERLLPLPDVPEPMLLLPELPLAPEVPEPEVEPEPLLPEPDAPDCASAEVARVIAALIERMRILFMQLIFAVAVTSGYADVS